MPLIELNLITTAILTRISTALIVVVYLTERRDNIDFADLKPLTNSFPGSMTT